MGLPLFLSVWLQPHRCHRIQTPRTPRNTTPTRSEDVVVQHDQKTCRGASWNDGIWWVRNMIQNDMPQGCQRIRSHKIDMSIRFNKHKPTNLRLNQHLQKWRWRCHWLPPASVNAFTVASKISRGVAAFTGTTLTSDYPSTFDITQTMGLSDLLGLW